MRRPQPSHPPAFLIDRDQQMIAPVDRAEIVGQGAQLCRVHAIAPEQDVACRISLAEEGALVISEMRAAQTEDRRNHGCSLAGIPESGKRANHPERGKAALLDLPATSLGSRARQP